MKNTRFITAIAISVILLGSSFVLSQDWPQWRGPNRDGKVKGFTPPKEWPKELTQKWKVSTGQGTDATPALVGDKLYVFTRQEANEVTLCMNAGSGKVIWEDKYQAQAVTGPAAKHGGPRSSPTVADGKVITLGVGGVISCLEASTGKVLWRKDEFPKMVPQFSPSMSPIIADGMCIAHLGGKDNAAVIAFDLASGNPKWKWTGDGPSYSSPVIMTVDGTKQVLVQTDKNLVSLALADGKLLWQIPTAAQKRFYNSATPIVDGTTLIYTGQGSGTKAVKIEKQGDAFAIKDLWSNTDLGTGFDTPVLKDGFLYGVSDKGTLFCLNAKDGLTAWNTSTPLGGGNFGSIVDAGNCLFALGNKGELVVFKPDTKEYSEIAKYKVSETEIYAHPVISGNRIFIKDWDSLAMFVTD